MEYNKTLQSARKILDELKAAYESMSVPNRTIVREMLWDSGNLVDVFKRCQCEESLRKS